MGDSLTAINQPVKQLIDLRFYNESMEKNGRERIRTARNGLVVCMPNSHVWILNVCLKHRMWEPMNYSHIFSRANACLRCGHFYVAHTISFSVFVPQISSLKSSFIINIEIIFSMVINEKCVRIPILLN